MRSPFSFRPIEKIWPGLRSVRKTWRTLCAATDGNTTIVFALACIPLFGLVGAAVDYSRANAIRTAMQAAADSTALAMSLVVSKNPTMSAQALQSQADTYFTATLTRNDAALQHPVTATYTTTGGSQVIVTANATMNTDFMSVLGIRQLPLSASSTTAWGSVRLRVALVLDNTGSMAQSSKLSTLKTATKNLLTQLQNASTSAGDVYVSIIPFVKDVSVSPTTNYTASWIDWTDWEAEPQILDTAKGGAKPDNWAQIGPGSSCPFPTSWGGNTSPYGFTCVSSPGGNSTVNSISSSGSSAGYICPSTDNGQGINPSNNQTLTWKNGIKYNGCYNSVLTNGSSTGSSAACPSDSNSYISCSCNGNGNNKTCTWSYYQHTWRPAGTAATPDHSSWNGCITDRGSWSGPDASNYDTNTSPTTSAVTATLFPAEQYSNCPLNVMPLNYNWSTMKTFVDSMVANGSTNQNIGLVHGWQSLVGGGPYPAPPAMVSGYTYQQVIVLLTDGLNTQDRWYGNGSATSTQVDARQYLTCANVKAAGITIYTIQVNTDNSPTSTLLKTCATDSSKFYLLTSSSQILDTFNQIGNNLSQLRVAK